MSVVLPVTGGVPGFTAVIVAVLVPDTVAGAVARPGGAGTFEMVATVASEELQVTSAVRGRVLESVYVPVAVNCSV